MTDEELVDYLINTRHLYPTVKDVNDFRRLLREGKIDPHLFIDEDTQRNYVTTLIEDDMLIDEIATTKNDADKIDLIQHGKATKYYAIWKNHPSESVRCVLARAGYYTEHFITDVPNVRNAALSHCPEKLIDYVNDKTACNLIHRYLTTKVTPDIELLEKYIQTYSEHIIHRFGYDLLEMFQLKLDAMKAQPTPLEQSMTEEQLKAVGNPLWARQHSILEIAEMTGRLT